MSDTHVYLGSWTNWADGHVAGRTLTTTSSGGAFLLVFAALFVTQAGNFLWQIVNYVVHQARTTEEARVSYRDISFCKKDNSAAHTDEDVEKKISRGCSRAQQSSSLAINAIVGDCW